MSASANDPHDRDQRLVAAANAGDLAAFEQLYGAYRGWVFALALRVSGERADADDVVQDTFAYLLGKLPQLELRARLTTFLYTVVKNLAIRARQRRARFGTDAEVLDALAAPGTGTSPMPRADLALALRGLPDAQREVVLMRIADDMALTEIALALEVPLGTVKSRLHHGLATLRIDPTIRDLFDP